MVRGGNAEDADCKASAVGLFSSVCSITVTGLVSACDALVGAVVALDENGSGGAAGLALALAAANLADLAFFLCKNFRRHKINRSRSDSVLGPRCAPHARLSKR